MEITITKGRSDDRIAIRRSDGSMATTDFPKKGPAPHDVVHFFVEREFAFKRGFWGMIAEGRHPEDIAQIAKAAGHASAARAGKPDADIVELLQAERLVECFEAELWSPCDDDALLLGIAQTACEASYVPMPAVPPDAVASVRSELLQMFDGWQAAPVGYTVSLTWAE